MHATKYVNVKLKDENFKKFIRILKDEKAYTAFIGYVLKGNHAYTDSYKNNIESLKQIHRMFVYTHNFMTEFFDYRFTNEGYEFWHRIWLKLHDYGI